MLPTHFFFQFLYYTDVAGVLFVLLCFEVRPACPLPFAYVSCRRARAGGPRTSSADIGEHACSGACGGSGCCQRPLRLRL